MEVEELSIPAVKLLKPKLHQDVRGSFCETYNRFQFENTGISVDFVQDNLSHSKNQATVRGLHFQLHPFAQAKLIRVQSGKVFDVAVDLRLNSPTFGQHVTAILSDRNLLQMFIPVGFAHGFMTLEPNTIVAYKVSQYYSPENDKGIFWNDPKFGIQWPLPQSSVTLSEKDQSLPSLADIENPFT